MVSFPMVFAEQAKGKEKQTSRVIHTVSQGSFLISDQSEELLKLPIGFSTGRFLLWKS